MKKMSLKTLEKMKIKNFQKNLELYYVLNTIASLDVSTVNQYREELILRKYLERITNNINYTFYETIQFIYLLKANIAKELSENLPKTSNNKYLNEVLIALQNKANFLKLDDHIFSENLENVSINLLI